MMEAIKEYLNLHHGVMWAPLAHIIRKTITVHTHGDYYTYATPNNKMIARMLHLPQGMNNLLPQKDAQTVQVHMPENEIDNKTLYDILDQICKDTDLNPYINQHKSKRDSRGVFLCNSVQVARPKPCECNSIRS